MKSLVWPVLASVLLPTAVFGLPLDKIHLPPGFKIEVYADKVSNARDMTLGSKGTLFVGSLDEDKVRAVVDKNGDQRADEVITIASGLKMPNGVAFKNGALYVSALDRILRFDAIESHLDKPPAPVVVDSSFPNKEHHGWKFIAFGPDGWLYVPVGVPCNVCKQDDPRFGTIMRMQVDGTAKPEIYAKGIRNTVGFAWHPTTHELWFTDNGRDLAGDDFPPDELNNAPKKGMNFGFPYCHGPGTPDPDLGNQDCKKFTPQAAGLGAHVAALGMRFYTGQMFPKEYQNRIFIAEHGSWNRTIPSGYRIVTATLDEKGGVKSTEVFADGWLQDSKPWGRPVDVQVMPDGALAVSDDFAGVVYRISYAGR
ncbi:MAG TPA: PQQ-dependent sugar dehydrogenase [Bdellovibrionota bacterium]|jgi:glucose/arabinose dehydrogenase|nr:PQQ-dependent sugar dehydrogenase [Bdellovibrionota bacterium]